jgi:soluble lytic murein transglycosylase
MESEAPRTRNRAAAVRRAVRWLLSLFVFSALITAAIALAVAPDPGYRLHGWLALGRYRAHDSTFAEVGAQTGVDPLLLKAIAWRESDLNPRKIGPDGGLGLLQIKASTARTWAAAERIETFMPSDLLDVQTNLRAGAWILSRSLVRWKDRDQPEIFALAEFKRGASEKLDSVRTAADLLASLDAATREFVQSVQGRRDFYIRHGW